MSTGTDIKAALVEVGAKFIIRHGNSVSGEGYLDYETNAQVTKPFIREHFLEVELPYDSPAVLGDVVEIQETGERYLVMNKTPDVLANEVVSYESVFYRCNVSGELLRISGETRANRYEKEYAWNLVRETCYALVTESLFGAGLEVDENLAAMSIENDEMYVPHRVGVQIGDRYEMISGEYRMVTDVKTRRFPAVDVATLKEDNRR